MPARRVLFADANRLTAHLWKAGQVTLEDEFGVDTDGLDRFAAYLKRRRSSLYYLLADVAEEGFHLEDVPYVTGADRGALFKRRLGQYYYGTPLSVAIPLGRSSEGRRDEKILFAALTRPDLFAPWLGVLREAEVPLAGVYSTPLVLARSGPRIVGSDGQALLVTLTRSGVRQSFFDRGQLYFSRLTQTATHSVEETSIACATETGKIYQYLIAQRQITRGKPLRTLVLAHPDQFDSLRAHCHDLADLHFEFVDIAAAARQEGLKSPLGDSRAEALLVHRLLATPPRHQFAPASERRFYHLWQLRFAMRSAAAVIFSACLLFSGKTLLQWHDTREQTEIVAAAAAADNQRYTAILDGLPKIAMTPDHLRAIMARYDEVAKYSPPLEPMLLHLSRALGENPRIELSRLEWRIAPSMEAGPASGQARPPAAAPTGGNSKGPWTVVDLSAQLPLGLASDVRAQIDQVERFAAQLRQPGYEVTILSLPFDIEPGKALRSQAEKVDSAADAPKFTLRLGKRL